MAVKRIGKDITNQLRPRTVIVFTAGVVVSTVIINSLRRSFPKFNEFMEGFNLPIGRGV
ncbi:MAG: hypothetical protein ACE5IR_11845 [bacterium]